MSNSLWPHGLYGLEWVVSTCACIKSELMVESLCPSCFLGFNELQVQSLGLEDPLEGEHGNPLQYSCQENPHGQRSLVATVHGVAKSRTCLRQLSTHLVQWASYWNMPSWVSLVPKPAFQTKWNSMAWFNSWLFRCKDLISCKKWVVLISQGFMEANIQQHSHLPAASHTMNWVSGCIRMCHCDADSSPVEIRGRQLLWSRSDILAPLWGPQV